MFSFPCLAWESHLKKLQELQAFDNPKGIITVFGVMPMRSAASAFATAHTPRHLISITKVAPQRLSFRIRNHFCYRSRKVQRRLSREGFLVLGDFFQVFPKYQSTTSSTRIITQLGQKPLQAADLDFQTSWLQWP